jgi:osmotically-inducible protein OsmY
MMNTIAGKTDTELKSDVLAELKWEPSVNVADIGVQVQEGAVTLNGSVTSYSEKWNAVRAARRVVGVTAIADDIAVKVPSSMLRTDGDIAAAAANQIKWSSSVPAGAAKITVREGWITLEGEMEWWYQKNAAETAVQYLAGVKGVSNQITIKPKLKAVDIESSIRTAFERNGQLDADAVEVETSGNKVTLRGQVRNYAERDEAERVAWAAPGVFSVENKLKVDWSWSFED